MAYNEIMYLNIDSSDVVIFSVVVVEVLVLGVVVVVELERRLGLFVVVPIGNTTYSADSTVL